MNELDEGNRKYWQSGMIYNNPNDPDIIVKKLSGLGWTLNFAHSRSYHIMALFLLVVVAIVIFASANN